MKKLKLLLLSISLAASSAPQAAGIPVIDSANLAQAIQQVTAWGTQANQMVEQLGKMQEQLENASGVRGVGNLANDTASRQYLPAEYQQLLQDGVGNWAAIQEATKVFDSSGLDSHASLEEGRKQAAINSASAEAAYKSASDRIATIQTLMDKINASPDQKDIQDLQARIQAENTLMQNETNKLLALQAANQAQREIHDQQMIEKSIQSIRKPLPAGW